MQMLGNFNPEDEIESIEFIGEQDTIDINVSGNRLFYANGILTHNSSVGNSDPDLSNVSESTGLSHTVDFMFALVANEELEKNGQIMIKQLKNRFGDLNYYNKFLVGINRARMRFYDLDDNESTKNIQQKAIIDDDSPFAMPSKFSGNYGGIIT